MSESCECSPEAGDNLHPAPTAVACPVNQQVGQRIDTLTLKALLALPLTELKSAGYRFCGAPDCPVVYYSGDGTQLFGEDQLRETVYQKHPGDDDAPVCYCFGHTRGSIRAELVLTGQSTVVEQIEAGIRAGQCACDIRNPQGNCCLGNVRALVAQIKMDSAAR